MQPQKDPTNPTPQTPVPSPIQEQGSDVTRPQQDTQKEAAANVVRGQIDRIYDGGGDPHHETSQAIQQSEQTPSEPPQHQEEAPAETEDTSPYAHTHSDETAYAQQDTVDQQWQQYHSAWQQYYQQYYQRYYMQHIQSTRQQLIARAQAAAQPQQQPAPVTASTQSRPRDPALGKKEAIGELKNSLIFKVSKQAQQVRKSRHFLPIMAGVVVLLLFGFLQYNRLIFAQVEAYVSPGSIEPQNVVIDPATEVAVGDEPRIIIPKINVDAPIVYDLPSIQEDDVQRGLEDGVVHWPIPGADSRPGQVGNSVFLGHSSNDVFDGGGYKFVFVQLEHLEPGDTFYIHYEGVRYTYGVTGKEVVNPDEVGKLAIDTDKPISTLVSCVPPGTALQRLLVYAEQLSPDPATASAAESPAPADDEDRDNMPGNSPTFFQRIFGGGT